MLSTRLLLVVLYLVYVYRLSVGGQSRCCRCCEPPVGGTQNYKLQQCYRNPIPSFQPGCRHAMLSPLGRGANQDRIGRPNGIAMPVVKHNGQRNNGMPLAQSHVTSNSRVLDSHMSWGLLCGAESASACGSMLIPQRNFSTTGARNAKLAPGSATNAQKPARFGTLRQSNRDTLRQSNRSQASRLAGL
jgi:hypothetical protein